MTVFKVNVKFSGIAAMDIDAATPEDARRKAVELEIVDLARPGKVDIFNFEVAVREITAASALGSGDTGDGDDEVKKGPRPSGWYRPLT